MQFLTVGVGLKVRDDIGQLPPTLAKLANTSLNCIFGRDSSIDFVLLGSQLLAFTGIHSLLKFTDRGEKRIFSCGKRIHPKLKLGLLPGQFPSVIDTLKIY
ncbi:hypothetical protein H261_20382 [Paramagnetospirillum caucaseum]|uniref:Uncharacterized protein n=1 Tax=Paramagnetospirillum caucaseum TaxID=1244869 RepID=M2Z1C2_9PROT|nr:hypothetical protein H261_20382 [Paramagnetospirillum caucaseum]